MHQFVKDAPVIAGELQRDFPECVFTVFQHGPYDVIGATPVDAKDPNSFGQVLVNMTDVDAFRRRQEYVQKAARPENREAVRRFAAGFSGLPVGEPGETAIPGVDHPFVIDWPHTFAQPLLWRALYRMYDFTIAGWTGPQGLEWEAFGVLASPGLPPLKLHIVGDEPAPLSEMRSFLPRILEKLKAKCDLDWANAAPNWQHALEEWESRTLAAYGN